MKVICSVVAKRYNLYPHTQCFPQTRSILQNNELTILQVNDVLMNLSFLLTIYLTNESLIILNLNLLQPSETIVLKIVQRNILTINAYFPGFYFKMVVFLFVPITKLIPITAFVINQTI